MTKIGSHQIEGGIGVESIVAGANVTVDATDPANPIISSTGGGGGGGGGWDHPVTLPLSTLTGWTPGSGTWTADANGIRQADTTAAQRRLHYGTKVPLAQVLIEVDIKLSTATSSALSRGGVVFGTPPTSDGGNGDGVYFQTNGSTSQFAVIHTEQDAVANRVDVALASPIAAGTWATLRILKSGRDFVLWVNGTLLTTVEASAANVNLGRFALYSYAADVSFRNLDIWTPTLP